MREPCVSCVKHKCLLDYFEAVFDSQAAFAVTTNGLEVDQGREECGRNLASGAAPLGPSFPS